MASLCYCMPSVACVVHDGLANISMSLSCSIISAVLSELSLSTWTVMFKPFITRFLIYNQVTAKDLTYAHELIQAASRIKLSGRVTQTFPTVTFVIMQKMCLRSVSRSCHSHAKSHCMFFFCILVIFFLLNLYFYQFNKRKRRIET